MNTKKKPKLDVEDFYHQFHNSHHHNDPGDFVKKKWHERDKTRRNKHRGLDLKSLAGRTR